METEPNKESVQELISRMEYALGIASSEIMVLVENKNARSGEIENVRSHLEAATRDLLKLKEKL